MKNKVSKIVISMLITSFILPNVADARISGRRRSGSSGVNRNAATSGNKDRTYGVGNVRERQINLHTGRVFKGPTFEFEVEKEYHLSDFIKDDLSFDWNMTFIGCRPGGSFTIESWSDDQKRYDYSSQVNNVGVNPEKYFKFSNEDVEKCNNGGAKIVIYNAAYMYNEANKDDMIKFTVKGNPEFPDKLGHTESYEKIKEINAIMQKLSAKIEEAKSVCSGISGALNTIYGLDVATTAVSAIGTAAAGGALAVGLIKDNDKIVKGENADKTKNAMGHARTGLMAASIATSGTSLGTSAAASVSAGKVAEKMKQCNAVVSEIKSINGKLKALNLDFKDETGKDHEESKKEITIADNIVNNCKGFDIAGINAIKNSMTASTVISGIGTGTAIAGTTTSALANSKKMAGSDKQKKLDLTSNIMAGITAGTSLSTTAVSGAVIGKVKAAIAVAKNCESAL